MSSLSGQTFGSDPVLTSDTREFAFDTKRYQNPPPKNQKRNTHHLQRKSAASSTPLQTETSDPSGVLSSSLACPEPTADLEGQSKTNIIVMC